MAKGADIGVLLAMPKPKGKGATDDTGMMDGKASAKKALWKAIKADDFEGFSEALDLLDEANKEPATDDVKEGE